MSTQTVKQMREDAIAWSRAKYPAVAVGRYRDAAARIEQLEKALRGLMPKGWDDPDEHMDHMPGIKSVRLALAQHAPSAPEKQP